MRGWQDKDGFHIVLEGELESQQLIMMLAKGLRYYEKMAKENREDETWQKAKEEAQSLYRKFEMVFIASNYRETSINKPVIARDKFNEERK